MVAALQIQSQGGFRITPEAAETAERERQGNETRIQEVVLD
jgi:hypothetical protein